MKTTPKNLKLNSTSLSVFMDVISVALITISEALNEISNKLSKSRPVRKDGVKPAKLVPGAIYAVSGGKTGNLRAQHSNTVVMTSLGGEPYVVHKDRLRLASHEQVRRYLAAYEHKKNATKSF